MIFDLYRGTYKIVRRYWKEYGGWKAVLLSPYFHISAILTFLTSQYWLTQPWWEVSLSVLPNIIGFAVGGYAIWMGFGDENFRQRISQRSPLDGSSPYLTVSAAFAHFVVVQLLALLIALFAKASQCSMPLPHWISTMVASLGFSTRLEEVLRPLFYGIGFLMLCYALMTAFAATFAIFRVSDWFVSIKNQQDPPDPKN